MQKQEITSCRKTTWTNPIEAPSKLHTCLHLLLSTYYLLPSTYCLLPTLHCLLPTTYDIPLPLIMLQLLLQLLPLLLLPLPLPLWKIFKFLMGFYCLHPQRSQERLPLTLPLPLPLPQPLPLPLPLPTTTHTTTTTTATTTTTTPTPAASFLPSVAQTFENVFAYRHIRACLRHGHQRGQLNPAGNSKNMHVQLCLARADSPIEQRELRLQQKAAFCTADGFVSSEEVRASLLRNA